MTELQMGNPHYRWLLMFLAAGAAMLILASLARARAAQRFSEPETRGRVLPATAASGRLLSSLLTLAALGLLSVALLDIRWGRRLQATPQKGIEVMFVLDVSRSMLAGDVAPNRLSRAKQQIMDMVDEMAGDRVGLVLFAGETRQAVPLTSHHGDFRQVLETVGPHSVQFGGSRLAGALSAAEDGFLNKTNDHRAIVIFTDGEDQESDPVGRARKLYETHGVRVFTVGLGDMDQGARIPDPNRQQGDFVEYQGRPVWSKMNGQVLQQIAAAANGAYIPAGTKQVDMAKVYHGYIESIGETEFETVKLNTYIPRFQWFAAPALLLLGLELWLTARGAPRQPAMSTMSKDAPV